MANHLTGAQRYNNRMNKIWEHYKQHQSNLPGAHLYGRLLEIAEEKLKITKEEARKKYGLFTVQQWEELLKIGWHK
jgi:hypothetical protein